MTSDTLARLRIKVERPPFHAVLRPEPVAVEAGTVVIRLRYRPEFRRAPDDAGYHGGVIAALIDLTAHAAVAIHVERTVPTVDLRIDYLRAAPGTDLIARGKVLRAGRSIARADVEVLDAADTIIAVGRGTYSTL
jgi:uncharacterized protein (TIGR00369 family)